VPELEQETLHREPRRQERHSIDLEGKRSGVTAQGNWTAGKKVVGIGAALALLMAAAPAQAPDAAAIIRSVDAAVVLRAIDVLGFTDTERYRVFRGNDETHPAAEMTVTDTYKKGVGKSYTIVSESGSPLIQRVGLNPLLDNEQKINLPGNIEKSWFISANYEMRLRPGGAVQLNGHSCYILDIRAKHKAPNLIDGSMWVDAHDGTLAQIDGMATQAASIFSGPAHMMRQYANVNGFSMAMHARAESNSAFFGRTVVTVDYSNYQLQVSRAK
jgi:hypothetical protein